MHKAKHLGHTLLSLSSSGSDRISNRRFSRLRVLLCGLWLFAGLLWAGGAVQAETQAGDILVADQQFNALFLVNPTTGQRTIFSNFSDSSQGPGSGLVGVAVGADGRIFVTISNSTQAMLLEVDPDTGNRTVVSNFIQGGVVFGVPYYGLAVDAKGRVIMNLRRRDPPGIPPSRSMVLRVDPDTDERTIVSDLGNPRQGARPGEATAVAGELTLGRTGKIFVSVSLDNDSTRSAIFQVHPTTGKRKLVSDFLNAEQGIGTELFGVLGMATERSGQLLVNGLAVILRIDPKTGQRTLLSDLLDSAQGPLHGGPSGLALEHSGDLVVAATNTLDPDVSTLSLYRVNPTTGQRTLLSDSDNLAQGPSLSLAVVGIAVVPNCRRHTSDERRQTGAEHHADRHACRER